MIHHKYGMKLCMKCIDNLYSILTSYTFLLSIQINIINIDFIDYIIV